MANPPRKNSQQQAHDQSPTTQPTVAPPLDPTNDDTTSATPLLPHSPPSPSPSPSLLTTLKSNPKSLLSSLLVSLSIITLAFDPQLLGSLYATPSFQHRFGRPYTSPPDDAHWTVPARWQMAWSMGGPLGQVVGAAVVAEAMEVWGRRTVLRWCVLATVACVAVQVGAEGRWVLLGGELIGGLVLGGYAVIAPAYASEVCPVELRGLVTSYINLCFVIGQLLANCLVAWTSRWQGAWAYKLPFAAQWIWPIVILIGLPFVPESPWWLVRKGRIKEAKVSLERLSSADVDVAEVLDAIIETDLLEQRMEAGSTYWDCFEPINARRTEIAIGVYCIQVISGTYLVGYIAYFFSLAGLPTQDAFSMSIAFLGLGFVGTVLSWVLLACYGRRSIYITGLAILMLLMFAIGILDCIPGYEKNKPIIWLQCSLMLVWNFVYDWSVGPVCFVIMCEVSATRVRSQTIALATAAQALLAIGMTIIIPLMINPDEANLRGKIGFFFGGLSLLSLAWAWLRIPETSNRTYEELDIMFARGVKTRDFKHYAVHES